MVSKAQGQIRKCSAVDQNKQDKSVRALLRNYKDNIPLVLLIDDRYAFFPYDLSSKGVAYAVLGVYLITNAWGVCFFSSIGNPLSRS
jgi:hypothetical protein